MMISKCVSNFIRAILVSVFLAVFLCNYNYENNHAYAATQTELEQAEKNKILLADSTVDYICAMSAGIAYSGDLFEMAADSLYYLGAEREIVYNKNRKADTKFIVIKHLDFSGKSNKNDYVISITGTEKLKDVEVDLRYGSVCFGGTTPEEFQIEQNKSLKEYGDNPNIPTIHRGFSDYVQTAFFTKSEETGKMGADYIFDILNDKNAEDIYITGHSLGGASAIILAARLSAMGVPADRLNVVTFGSPAVGNQAFADWCRGRFNLKRIAMKNDVITGVLQGWLGKRKFVQFGDTVEWRRDPSVRHNQHAVAVYMDSAIRNYYKICMGMPGDNDHNGFRYADKNGIWSGDDLNGNGYNVYIAPVNVKLDDYIQGDSECIKMAVQDILLNVLPGSVADIGEVKDFSDTCKAAERMGCQYVLYETVTGTLDKNSQDLYHVTIEEGICDTSGNLLFTQLINTNSSEVTPIEAAMIGITRSSENRINVVKNDAGLKLGSIFSK